MLAAGFMNGSGVVAGQMPPLLSDLSFALVGWFIGERFRGIKWRDVVALAGPMTVSFAVTGLVALAFSELIVALSHIPQSEAIVAFSPGGVEAMSILALALHLDPVFVGVCEPGSLDMISVTAPTPASIGAAVTGETVTVRIEGDLPPFVVVTISGIRAGSRGVRFPRKTREQMLRNNSFWDQSKC